MNPHFIFNCLNSVQHYILNQDAKSANFYLSRFAGLVRQTLDNSAKIHIPVVEEIAYLKNYLELESLQLSGAFSYTISADDGIDQERVMIPNMVLQPYVENAVKHGVGQLAGEGYITISFHLRDAGRELECCIEDNGRGIIHTQAMKRLDAEKHQSYGMAITDKRIRTLNQLSQGPKDISVAVEDLGAAGSPAQGTRVAIRFPV
jgi:LytS/YehU family sensor histidine kinase